MMALRILPWAIWVAIALFSVATFGGLPEEIPRHLSAAGEVTRSEPRSWGSWMLLPFITLGTLGLLTGITAMLPRRPDLFNFPEKERLLALPEEYRSVAISEMQTILYLTGTLVTTLLGSVQVVLWRAAHGHPTPNLLPIIAISSIAFLPLVLWLTSRVNDATIEADRRFRATAAGKDSRTSGQR